MKRYFLSIATLALAFLLTGLIPVVSATHAQTDDSTGGNCKQVGGTFIINFIDQTTGLAVLTGDLRGAVRGVILKQTPADDGTLTLELEHIVTTESGDIIRTQDIATLTPVIDQIFLFQQTQTVMGGTNEYENATGTLTEFGVVDFATGQAVLRYNGEICTRK